MGLLVAKFLAGACGHTVKWTVLKGPETDPSFNLPVLSGFGKLTFDPIGESIREAYAVLDGRREGDASRNIFVLWRDRADFS